MSSITVAPLGQLVSTNVASETANVTIATGATQVTYTDYATTGYLVVCPTPYQGLPTGTLGFTVNPGNLGPFTVPYGACSQAITVNAGSIVINSFTCIWGSNRQHHDPRFPGKLSRILSVRS